MSKNLTSRSEDYSKWYNELVVKADLAENSAVRGCMVIKPYGYAIWEKMQAELDRCLKKQAMKMRTFHYLYLKVYLKLKKKMQKDLPKNVLLLLIIGYKMIQIIQETSSRSKSQARRRISCKTNK